MDTKDELVQKVEAWIRHGEAVPASVTTYDREVVHQELRGLLSAVAAELASAASNYLYNQQEVADALDDLVASRGVTLDDGRLDWLAEWVSEQREAPLVRVKQHLQGLIDDESHPADWKAGLVLARLVVEGYLGEFGSRG